MPTKVIAKKPRLSAKAGTVMRSMSGPTEFMIFAADVLHMARIARHLLRRPVWTTRKPSVSDTTNSTDPGDCIRILCDRQLAGIGVAEQLR
jgi:hypothetical protein